MLYSGIHTRVDVSRICLMSPHTLTTPVIEMAWDGKTAKGVSVTPGAEAHAVKVKMTAFRDTDRAL